MTDALGRTVTVAHAPRRIVSLVPSETESVATLVGIERLVGRTDYCEEPVGQVEGVETVGGTKGFSVEAVLALRPDLVLANQEENSRPQVEALIREGVTVHVSFPCTFAENLAYLRSLCALLHVEANHSSLVEAERELAGGVPPESESRIPIFVPIWREPWMTFDERTYASDLLRLAGAHNVFGSRPRKYPLAADLGKADEKSAMGRDTRYPRMTLSEVEARAPQLVWLPDEPYAFTAEHADELGRELGSVPIQFVSGKDLFWYGTRVTGGLARLRAQVAAARAVQTSAV